MKTINLRSLGLLTLLTVAAGCADMASPTGVGIEDASLLTGSTPTGVHDVSSLYGAVGPSFELSPETLAPNGLLTAAADKKGGKLKAVRRARTLNRDRSKTRSIDPVRGGSIRIGRAGMRVVIPAGALPGTDPIDITVLAYEGKYHVYDFLPHGLQFNAPIRVEFDITNIKAFGDELEKRLKDLEGRQKKYDKCQKKKDEGKNLSNSCRRLFEDWEDYNEDRAWYEEVVDEEGFVGVYFDGDVKRGGNLHALELFDIDVATDQLIFNTTHFSGYALGM